MPPILTAMSFSSPPASGSHREYDLRVRTLSFILAALEVTNRHSPTTLEPNPVLVKEEAELYPVPEGSPDGTNAKHVHPDSDTLKLLNQLALLLVREHEIVAVLPKRFAPQGLQVMVSIDSDSDSDEERVGWEPAIKYLVTRNPRSASPSPRNSNAGAAAALSMVSTSLIKVTTLKDMYQFLVQYQHTSFLDHVSSIQLLLNRIIVPQLDSPCNEKFLFERFITFRAAPKMHRRFKSLGFTSFLEALKSLQAQNIRVQTSVAFHLQKRKITATRLSTRNEAHEQLVPSILYHHGFVSPESKCPYLWEQYDTNGSAAEVVYSPEVAAEFNQVLIYCLEKAAAAVAEFTNAHKAGTHLSDDDSLLTAVELWMRYLHVIAHESAIFKVHVEALDGDITNSMRKALALSKQTRTQAALDGLNNNSNNPEKTNTPFQPDEDCDGGLSDTALEIFAAQAVSRAGQQALWLAVSYQHAVWSVSRPYVLPKTPLKLKLFTPPVEDTPSTQMHPWKTTVARLFSLAEHSSPVTDGIVTANDGLNISVEEVIETLEDYGKAHGGKSSLFLPNHKRNIPFRGVYHAESILATMAYLSSSTKTDDENHRKFRNTYRTIGVSKRCCPICTKLLSLLTHPQRQSEDAFTVLCSHPNIYPTSLPPLVPPEVAERLIAWLEELLKHEIVRLVKKKRRSTGTSADSKGDSPRKEKDSVMTQPVEAVGKVTALGGVKKFVRW